MYTVNQGPSKLVAKTRTGLSQNYEKIESIRKNNSKVNGAQSANKSNIGLHNNGSNCSGNQLAGSVGGDSAKINNNEMDINVAKPVFQQYRRTNSNRSNSSYKNGLRIACFKDEEPEPIVSPQYEELIRYIRDSWNVLSAECEHQSATATDGAATPSSSMSVSSSASSTSSMPTASSSNSNDSNHTHTNGSFKRTKKVIVYHNDPPSPALQDFGPFDLESWWGRRLFNNITKSL